MEHVLRQCLIALRIAERMGLDESQRAAVYYTALLINVGCHSDAHEQAKWFGDDIAMKADKYSPHGLKGVRATLSGMRRLGSGQPPLRRFRTLLDFATGGYRDLDSMIEQHSRMARELAARLGLPAGVRDGVGTSYEQWDGKGWPGELQGESVPIASRIAQLSEFVEVAHRRAGIAGALAVAEKRSGSQFDPALVACLRAHAKAIFGDLDAVDSWQAVIDAEPALAVVLGDEQFDQALEAIADFVDLKSPYTLGHSRAVADLAAAAGTQAGVSKQEVVTLRRAGLVHDLGRLGVSNSIWDKPGPLGAGERERVRLHPYFTQRMLRQSEALAPLGEIAVAHHERMDGSGYPSGLQGSALSASARLLGAADAYQTKREPRPHRLALTAAEAASALRDEVKARRLDAPAVEAVLAAAGHRIPRRQDGPSGLTHREVEVLRLVARGQSNHEIAERLTISPKTASHHVEHIYSKIGASNRASASLFAVQHGLLPAEEP
jgi:HD-GYP domain-containing protein (c-di-GMP phosphodiesterase class II)